MNPICNRKNYFQFYRTFAKLTSIRSRLLSTDIKSKQIASKLLLEAKQKSNLTFDEIAKKLNVNKVWLTSAILGQHPIEEETLSKLIKILDIDRENSKELEHLIETIGSIPDHRGGNISNDPIIRRFNELIDVYGDAIKLLIREEFGDGIMSAIDCTINFEKKVVDNEKRILITIDGKYLQYKNKI
ncbi:Cyanate hydratase [Sarcoptes scabiei]|uniref:Cyanate hydratase n=1 Tax=Sarcoptes scabiei TaxID=52283 RepID=A0A834RAT2_SARSC|nr:Cyanate hydratase [Sarcoptes scabiei]UXI19476.1 hypothetical protein NH340_JMT05419 [Sarcoptes scabiei]